MNSPHKYDRAMRRLVDEILPRLPQGAVVSDLVGLAHCHNHHVNGALRQALALGLVKSHPFPGYKCPLRRIWYSIEHYPARRPTPPKIAMETPGRAQQRRVAPGVRATVCPTPADRYTFTPPPGWTGQITRDRDERRGVVA